MAAVARMSEGRLSVTRIEMTVDGVRHSAPRNIWMIVLKEKGTKGESPDTQRYLPVQIGEDRAAMVIGELVGPATNAPDIFLAGINATDSTVESVIIDRLEEEVFHSQLALRDLENPHRVDCPTATGIALAARFGAPILVEEAVWDIAGLTVHPDWPNGVADSVLSMANSARQ
jgi:bifunctional DNase/RNase